MTEVTGTGQWDPVPQLAALIDGLVRAADSGPDVLLRARVANLMTGPYAALRGGLGLGEPGREGVSTEQALREALDEHAARSPAGR